MGTGARMIVYALVLGSAGCIPVNRDTLTPVKLQPSQYEPLGAEHGYDPSRLTLTRTDHTASHFLPAQHQQDVGLLAQTGQHEETPPVSSRYVITVVLQIDVRKLNTTALRDFRKGVAAALGVPSRQVHIVQVNERKNAIELYVSSGETGVGEPFPSREVLRSLNLSIMHRHLHHFGITDVVPEKNVLQGQHEQDNMWAKEGFYAVVIFLTIFVIIVTCLMVLYRLKEKVELSDQQLKEPPGHEIRLSPIPVRVPLPPSPPPPPPVKVSSSMGQAEPILQPSGMCINEPQGIPTQPMAELKPCLPPSPSPFRMKPSSGLQERRGSNVSLVLDMSVLGAVEPLCSVPVTPRERMALERLQSSSRPLTPLQLADAVLNTPMLNAEFAEIPMNFVNPKELDIPSHGTKNRYKTILPNPHTRVILKTKNSDPLSSYINANYVRGYRRSEKAYIATQGPMINTVNDFWQMAWQEDCPIIVMITKLKEKNEKCVLYWPEKRGIYGKVEVLISGLRECEHYTVRNLTLKQGDRSRSVKHYWYTSWPDHKTPESAQPLLQLMAEVEEEHRAVGIRGPVIVHCSAGIGRSGCFIATTIGCCQLEEEGIVDVLGILCQLRGDRGGMIQTGEQYEFVHHALKLYASRLSAETGP